MNDNQFEDKIKNVLNVECSNQYHEIVDFIYDTAVWLSNHTGQIVKWFVPEQKYEKQSKVELFLYDKNKLGYEIESSKQWLMSFYFGDGKRKGLCYGSLTDDYVVFNEAAFTQTFYNKTYPVYIQGYNNKSMIKCENFQEFETNLIKVIESMQTQFILLRDLNY